MLASRWYPVHHLADLFSSALRKPRLLNPLPARSQLLRTLSAILRVLFEGSVDLIKVQNVEE